MKKKFPCVLLALALAAFTAQASPLAARSDALVDSVQMPAWVERNGQRQPLAPGATLQNRDRVTTGAGARVLIALADGSAVKLGENAEINLNALGRRADHVFTAALDVRRGAFRLATGVFPTTLQQRLVNVRVAAITAGVRGGDLWARANAESDLVCLIDGAITVVHAQDEPRAMSEPGSLYFAAKGTAPQAMTRVDRAQLAVWATETELWAESGHAQRGCKWKVELANVGGQAEALALYDQAGASGYAASIKPKAAVDGGYSYSVRVTQLPTKADALALAGKVAAALDLATPAVSRD